MNDFEKINFNWNKNIHNAIYFVANTKPQKIEEMKRLRIKKGVQIEKN